MKVGLRACAALVLCGPAGAARPAGAQPAAPPAAVAALPRDAYVRVSRGGFRLEGRVAGPAGDTLVIRPAFGGPPFRAPLAPGDTVWASAGRAVGRGALIGGALGGVALTTLALAAVRGLCDSPGGCRGDYPNVVALGLTFGGGGGALLGAGVGALHRTWRRVHP